MWEVILLSTSVCRSTEKLKTVDLTPTSNKPPKCGKDGMLKCHWMCVVAK